MASSRPDHAAAAQITNDELDRQVDTDKPVKVVDKEPDSPAAVSVPFATLPTNIYIKGPRYRVLFDRILTPRFTKDVDELRTWIMDIRQVLSDNAIKDMLAEEDSKFLSAVNTGLVGQDSIVPASGVSRVAIDLGRDHSREHRDWPVHDSASHAVAF